MKEHRKLAAIMFTDIVGYSALMSKDEKHALDVLVKNRNIHKAAIARFDGEYIKEVGDGTLAIFNSSLDAVGCALEIQKTCGKDPSLKIRIGIHTGDIVVSEGDVFGDNVNIGSRIEAAGQPGGIYVSEKVYDDIKNNKGIKTEFYGEKVLKNIDYPVKIYSIDTVASKPVKKPSLRLSERISIPGRPRPTGKTRTRKTWLFLGVSAVVLATVAFLVFLLPMQKSESHRKRIVVAEFENRTGNPSLDMLGKMVADWITQGLSRSVDGDVVPMTTVMQFSGSEDQSAEPAKEYSNYLSQLAKGTHADFLVSGSYYLQDTILRFLTEVKNLKDGSLIYSLPAITGSFQKPMEAIEKLTSEITGGLAYHFKVSDIQFVSKPPNVDAYTEYLAGLELFGSDFEGALRHFIRAIKMDSLFWPAKYFTASSYINMGEYTRADSLLRIVDQNREQLTPFERYFLDVLISYMNANYTECVHYLHLAESISPGDWNINYMIGTFAMFMNKPGACIETFTKYDETYSFYNKSFMAASRIDVLTIAYHLLGNYQEELSEARKGQQMYPEYLINYNHEIRALAGMGRLDDIDKVIDGCSSKSFRFGMLGTLMTVAATELRVHGYVREAQEYAVKAVEWYRNRSVHEDVRPVLATALYIAESYMEAKIIFEELAEEYPDGYYFLGYLGSIAAKMGEREKAMRISEQLKQINLPYLFGEHTFWRARIAAQLGDREQAMELLRESISQGKVFDATIHRCPDFEPLQDYAPFREFLKPKE